MSTYPRDRNQVGSNAGEQGPWRDEHLLVVRDRMPMPPRCAICNRPAHGAPVRKVFHPKPGAGFSAGMMFGLVGALVAHALSDPQTQTYTGPIELDVPLCKSHRYRPTVVFAMSLGLAIGFGGWAYKLYDPDHRISENVIGLLVVAGIAALIAFCVAVGAMEFGLRAKQFYGSFVWLEGSNTGYLLKLPKLDAQTFQRLSTNK